MDRPGIAHLRGAFTYDGRQLAPDGGMMIRDLWAVCLAIGVWSVSSTALASDRGFAIGLRTGYAIAHGREPEPSWNSVRIVGLNDLPGDVKGMIPLWLGAGYRIHPALYVGAFVQYGVALVNEDNNAACRYGVRCSAHDLVFGANVHYHILPDARFDPWVGAGLGYELLTFNMSGALDPQLATIRGSETDKGLQFLILETGVDLKATSHLALGPFLSFALGQFNSYSTTLHSSADSASEHESGKLEDGPHQWLTVGVRGQWNL